MRGAQKIISLSAIRHNIAQIKQHAPDAKFVAAIKANAYGHHADKIIPALAEADLVAVVSVEEALVIRKYDKQKPIILLEGLFDKSELKSAIKHRFETIISTPQQLDWELESAHKFERIWLKIDTGMGRLGFSLQDSFHTIKRLLNKYQQQSIVLTTHFSSADDADQSVTLEQIDRFNQVAQHFPNCQKSLCNSAGTFAFPQAHEDYIRIGISLYGVSPFEHISADDLKLKPVMTLKTKILSIKAFKKGSPIGYNQHGIMPNDGLVAICQMGYADGYLRFIPSGSPILIGQRIFYTIGRVSMDMLAVVVDQHVSLDDEVICWGEGLPIETIAKKADTIAYQLLTTVTQRPQLIVEN